METGFIKFYLAKVEKRYGFFISDKDGKEVFFHRDRSVSFACDGSDEPAIVDFRDREPRKDDPVIFERFEGVEKGPCASSWGFKKSYDEALEAIENRVEYRLMERIGYKPPKGGLSRGPVDVRVKWQGKNLTLLRGLHPRYIKVVKDEEHYGLWFEKRNGEQWEPCDDPR